MIMQHAIRTWLNSLLWLLSGIGHMPRKSWRQGPQFHHSMIHCCWVSGQRDITMKVIEAMIQCLLSVLKFAMNKMMPRHPAFTQLLCT